MDRPPVEHGPSSRPCRDVAGTVSPIASDHAQRSMHAPPGAECSPSRRKIDESDRPAHPGGVLGDGLHDRLEVGRRARDDPQDLAGGRLLLERLFRLVEQADVLDGDDRLGGEGLQELDLPVGERPNLGPPDGDRPDGLGPAEQGNAERCPETEDRAKCAGVRVLVDLGLHDRGRGSSAGRVPHVPRSVPRIRGNSPDRSRRGSAPRERRSGARRRRPGRLWHRRHRTDGRRSSTPPRTLAGRRSASSR